MISFTGSYLHITDISKKMPKGPNKKEKLIFVELKPNSRDDNLLFAKLKELWADEDTFIREMDSNFIYKRRHHLEDGPENFYVLTTQKKKLNKMDASKVLAVAQTTKNKDNSVSVDYIQALPKSIRMKSEEIYQSIGSVLMNSIKKEYPDRSLTAYSQSNNVGFYKGNGFEEVSKTEVGLSLMRFNPKK